MKNKIAFWIITFLSTVIMLYILVITVLQPVFTKNPLPRAVVRTTEVKAKSGKADKDIPMDDTIQANDVSQNSKSATKDFFDLRKKEILLQSRLTLATEDSTYLVLDLRSNTAILELKGVSLHECHIIESHISNSIKMYPTEALLNWMTDPFVVKHIEATIPKIVYIEKIAPKDTLEANKMVVEPKSTKLEDVYIVIDFDRNLRLVITQSEKPDEEGEKIISAMRQKYQKIEMSRSLKSLTKFNREPVKPQIDIVIPRSDATILYKALPLNPRMILRM